MDEEKEKLLAELEKEILTDRVDPAPEQEKKDKKAAKKQPDRTPKKKPEPEQEPEAEQPPEKLSYKAATVGLTALVLVLLVFFLGMRWIERRAEQIALPAEISAAPTDTAAERTLPESGGLDINTATKEELMELPGIGEKKAQAIIDYRNEYGAFLDAAEIMEVDGIGEGIFEKIRDLIRV